MKRVRWWKTPPTLDDFPSVEYEISLKECDSMARWVVPRDTRKPPRITLFLPSFAEIYKGEPEGVIEMAIVHHFLLERVCMGRYFERTRMRKRCGRECPPYRISFGMLRHVL